MKKNKTEKKFINRVPQRLLFLFAAFCIVMMLVVFRLGYHMIVKGEDYAQQALKMQTNDETVTAIRGNILDSEGNYLALSYTTNTVWVRPSSLRKDGQTKLQWQINAIQEAKIISSYLNIDIDEIYDVLTSQKSFCKLATDVSDEIADALSDEKLSSVEIIRGFKRDYPMDSFASHVIGFLSYDMEGEYGLECYYDEELTGTNGRLITITDRKKNTITTGKSTYYSAEDGYTIVTTIESNIQHIVEEQISAYTESLQADKIIAIVMDPSNGDVLAMAQSNRYDLNNPRSSAEGDEEYYITLSDEEQLDYWYSMWRNNAVCDVYEPGSTFKTFTTALALDYGVTTVDELHVCDASVVVEDRTIKCNTWPAAHGEISTRYALAYSCNCIMTELAGKIGKENFYRGLEIFGLTEKTGIDYPGEAYNIIYEESVSGPVELATMSFGQGIAVTPISLISAISSFANEGKLMQPHLVKRILDSDGNTILENEPEVKNITVSKETAADMLSMLETVVTNGGGMTAAINGYRVGGKTGSAQKAVDGVYSETEVITSFVGIAPLDDPQFVILVIVDNPAVDSSGLTACVCEKAIMEQVLKYKNIAPVYTAEELEAINASKVEVPDLTNFTIEDAISIIVAKGLNYEVFDDENCSYINDTVIDQYPKAGTLVKKDYTVSIYYR